MKYKHYYEKVKTDESLLVRRVIHIQKYKTTATDNNMILNAQYTQYKINKGEAITAIGSTAIVEAAISEGVVGILT